MVPPLIVKSHFHNGNWEHGYLWHSLQSVSQQEAMDWTTNSNIICSTYSDSLGHDYISYMQSDILITIDCKDEKAMKKFSKEVEKANIKAPSTTWRQLH